jgi:protein-L-isoaspartate(D-aspartate) O-methyltransferase
LSKQTSQQKLQLMKRAAAMVRGLRPAIADERVLSALRETPREPFVPPTERRRAYENVALPIACEQTISQPLVVARMLELLSLRATDRVLDVGTGSGYHAALLARLTHHVWTIERHPELSEQAGRTLARLGIENVSLVVGDGADGLPDQAPFDAINVAAAVDEAVPSALEDQLAPGGRLVAPVGTTDQHLILTLRTDRGLVRQRLEPVRFVPLVRQDRAGGA